jgi:hypothetical protein
MNPETARQYQAFAEVEARGSSPTYERLARAIAADEFTMDLLNQVDERARQPNLLLATLRWHDVDVSDVGTSVSWIQAHSGAVLDVLRTRRTQTNEVARCATLLVALARLPPPLAIVEIGASAGLCLMYDQWRYRYAQGGREQSPGTVDYLGRVDSPVTLNCAVTGVGELPTGVPTIAWRAGLDLNPLDASDPDTRRWLQALVWPEHRDRAVRLAAALAVAAATPPRVLAGDMVRDLEPLLDQAPRDATLVVTHSAALSYLAPDQVAELVDRLRQRGVHRVGAEAPRVLAHLSSRLGDRVVPRGQHLLSIDDEPLAFVGPHGGSLTWL